ncbi:MAG: hypothetical protein BroJett030_05680 [Alphaproteobacteria bacterium]|nr:MAG: hypothetical protein BroJett030_05680 [Alphaproteobacteria bacterium]
MRVSSLAPAAAGLLACLVGAGPAAAGPASSEAAFYRAVAGKWSGPGEIVAGKYKGTRFTCVFDGLSPDSTTGLSIDGTCRVGMFSQPMNAVVQRAATGYSGRFLDGEAGEGMDVVGGRYSRSKLVVDIKRKDLRGVIVAHLTGADKLNVTISVRVDRHLIPVIGMALDRQGGVDDIIASSTDR